jgi:olefin beta-lactone synthetase
MAESAPFRPAIILPAGREKDGRSRFIQLSFQQLNLLCDQYAHGLSAYGIERGQRVLLLIRPGIELIAVTFALMKMGAVPVLIDPGMGRKAFLQCITETAPDALIGIPLAHLLRRLFPRPFRTVRRAVSTSRRFMPGAADLAALRPDSRAPFPVAETTAEDEAAVAFTSGGTGIPKGVLYLHGMFARQVEVMRREMDVAEGEVHLAAMYIFALFNPALGVTTVIPDMDPRKTAEVNPAYLVEAIQTFGVTMSMGSPVIWKKVNAWCLENRVRLPSIKHVFMFGAPVYPEVIRDFTSLLDGGRVYTPFGATEALPVTLIDDREILEETAALTCEGKGVCVGRPAGGMEVRIIPHSDAAIPRWDNGMVLPADVIGEIVVRGTVVTREYLNRPEETAKAKIPSPEGVWHRMGDMGYIDEKGRLWYCGRKAHRVETETGLMLPVCCESIFNRHSAVARTALIGIGEYGVQAPVLIVELEPGTAADKKTVAAELLALGAQYEHTRPIKKVLFHPAFPVDVRHNAKIQRHELAAWARGKVP